MIVTFKELDKEKTIISLPTKLTTAMQDKIKQTDFQSISEYVTFLLRILLYTDVTTSESDTEKVKKRLEELGYL